MAEILARKDGKTLRNVSQIEKLSNTGMTRNEPTKEPVKQDGFSTILKCRWCGKKSKEVYIPKYKDGEDGKPLEIVYNYEPCEECQKAWADMVVIIEVTDVEPYPDCLPITSAQDEKKTPLYPTGRHVGVTEAAAQECISKDAHKGTVFFMELDMFKDVFKAQFAS